jgi:general nucleoside transport system permease protein
MRLSLGALSLRDTRIRLVPAPPRTTPPALLRMVVILVGLAFGGLFLALQPGVGTSLFNTVWVSTLGTPLGLTQLLQLGTPLVLAGCAVSVAARAGLWNIGVEGQIFFGGWLATATGLYLPDVWRPLFVALILLASFIGGALWALLPALARAYWNVSEIVTTLMLNFVATFWVVYWATGPWSANELQGSGSITSRPLPDTASLPQLALGSVTVGTGLFIAIAVVALLAAALRYTHYGFSVDFTGVDARASRHAGINVRRAWIGAFLLSGGIGGLTGGVVELDQVHSLSAALSQNTGYIGIVVAVLAGTSFLLCLPMGFLMAFLSATGIALQLSSVSSSAVLFLTGLVMLLAASAGVFARYRLSLLPPATAETATAAAEPPLDDGTVVPPKRDPQPKAAP